METTRKETDDGGDVNVTDRILLHSLPPVFAESFRRLNFEKPTDVQRQCWKPLLKKKNCVVCAPTGGGKTLGFLLPMACNILEEQIRRKAVDGSFGDKKYTGPSGLVLSPTRELAQQTARVAQKLKQLSFYAIVGGKSKEEQVSGLEASKALVLIATPGRLIDLVEANAVNLRSVRSLVVDEADRMLDIGLSDQLEKISGMIGQQRHTSLFSATFPDKAEFERLVDSIVGSDRTNIFVGETAAGREIGGMRVGISPTVTQTVHVCAGHKRAKKLMKFVNKLKVEDHGKRQGTSAIIFCNTKKAVNFVFNFLRKNRVRVDALHGDLPQHQREKIVGSFRAGKIRFLVATDVAARGLDVSAIGVVVNWDMAPRLEQYVHRVGRTGRQGRSGMSYTFFTRNFAFLAPDLVELLKRHDQVVDPNMAALALDAPKLRDPVERARERKRKRDEADRRRASSAKNADEKEISFKDRCWLAGQQKKKASGGSCSSNNNNNDSNSRGVDATKKRDEKVKTKRPRGKRGGKKGKKKRRVRVAV